MKKLLFILFLFINSISYSQLFTAKTFSFCTINRGEKWTPFSEKELVNFPIEVDSSDNLIVLHANKLQVYTIYKSNVFINEGEKVYYFYCEDKDKLSCIILLALDRNGLNKNEMEIMYSNAKIKYELK
jgi:hypothetical protein